ncbi:MAG: hypothetical protein AAF513_10175 [Pseudomonadota bacterium]
MKTPVDNTHCARALVKISDYSKDESGQRLPIREQLGLFRKAFNDTFLLVEKRDDVLAFVNTLKALKAQGTDKKTENRGFVKIVQALEKILVEGSAACSCRMCGTIGDAVLTLDMPHQMRMEHTDHAFDHLCSGIGKLHFKHPSEQRFIRDIANTM